MIDVAYIFADFFAECACSSLTLGSSKKTEVAIPFNPP